DRGHQGLLPGPGAGPSREGHRPTRPCDIAARSPGRSRLPGARTSRSVDRPGGAGLTVRAAPPGGACGGCGGGGCSGSGCVSGGTSGCGSGAGGCPGSGAGGSPGRCGGGSAGGGPGGSVGGRVGGAVGGW